MVIEPSSSMQRLDLGRLGFTASDPYPPSLQTHQEIVSPNMTQVDIDDMGYYWGAQQQPLNASQISDGSFDPLDDIHSRTHTPDGNIRNFSDLEPYASDSPTLSFEPYSFDLADPNLSFINQRDFNMSLQPTFDVVSSASPLSAADPPQPPGPTTTHNPIPSLTLRHAPVPPAVTNTIQSQRFHCVFNGCTKHYKRKHELNRHQKDHSGARLHPCNVSGCNRSGHSGFVRRDHLRQHMRKVHGTTLP
ncbi:hypothetical protein B0O99DRAFT_301256 [Bisporella sp. PMI_857]|nr:hypothetical protein B0O99DRAFT_301256 [Bisporella sp. PMI_857]